MKKQRIGIIGAGPGGLMLGLLLQQQGHDVSIYEKASPDSNQKRGGSLDIHEESGQLALKEADIFERFQALARVEGEDTRVLGKDGTVYFEEIGQGTGDRPEIDRGKLCDIIIEKLKEDTIQYGYTYQSLTELDNGKVTLQFLEDEVQQFDMVVGADGAFSKVRNDVAHVDVTYNDISMIELNIDDVVNKHPDLAQINSNGSLVTLGDYKGILGQFTGNGRIKVYVAFRMPSEKLDDYKALSVGELKEQLLEDFSDWDEDLKKYIKYASDDVMCRRIYKLPIGFKWDNHPHITLIGDAAHVMSPFAGEGVNMALYDAYLLAKSIERNEDLQTALKQYEEAMYESSAPRAQESQDNLELMFSQNSAQKFGDFFNQAFDEA